MLRAPIYCIHASDQSTSFTLLVSKSNDTKIKYILQSIRGCVKRTTNTHTFYIVILYRINKIHLFRMPKWFCFMHIAILPATRRVPSHHVLLQREGEKAKCHIGVSEFIVTQCLSCEQAHDVLLLKRIWYADCHLIRTVSCVCARVFVRRWQFSGTRRRWIVAWFECIAQIIFCNFLSPPCSINNPRFALLQKMQTFFAISSRPTVKWLYT